MDSISLELYRHRFAGVAEEMGEALKRTGFSPNIKERLDFSCALFDGEGALVAQAAHIPVHLGAMAASVAAARGAVKAWRAGDVVILNDPFAGGTHLPDVTLVSPVFCGRNEPDFYVASRAHHADIGGMSPGSLPLSREIYQEGLIIPPLLLVEAGARNEALFALILRNTRTPDERRGDLEAQLAAGFRGAQRLRELVEGHGREEVTAYARHLQTYAEKRARAAIASWPDGTFCASDVLEAGDELAQICVAATISGETIRFDFAGTSGQVAGSLNAVGAIARSACFYVVACLLGDVPLNAGTFAPVEVVTPRASVVDASFPAAVAGGNVETSQRIVDVVTQALGAALPDQIPACSAGTMNNLTMGGLDANGAPWTYYETLGGGAGASCLRAGASAVQTHMTNTLNTPIEALERAFPLRVREYRVRRGSGGDGLKRGGDGLVREYEFLSDATVTMLSTRRATAPPGANGGQNGASGRNLLNLDAQAANAQAANAQAANAQAANAQAANAQAANAQAAELPAQWTREFKAGECLRIETPGGGGWGTREV